jgi:hypothetical protein
VPVHPLWLIVVLAILVILGLPLVLMVLMVAVLPNRRAGQAPAYGLRSPDGRWWWDGRQWQPVPPANQDRG